MEASGAATDPALRTAHERFVTAAGARRVVRDLVADSWRRCAACGVPPDGSRLPPLYRGSEEFDAHRRAHPLAVVLPLFRDLLGTGATDDGHLFAIGDADGTLLWVEGDSATRARAERMRFAAGVDWSERAAGTNAPGTALALGAAVQIVAGEHYSAAVHAWACAAAPIRDPRTGRLLGVVDLTGGRSIATPPALAAVRAAALAAEAQLAHIFATEPRPPRIATLPIEAPPPRTPTTEAQPTQLPEVGARSVRRPAAPAVDAPLACTSGPLAAEGESVQWPAGEARPVGGSAVPTVDAPLACTSGASAAEGESVQWPAVGARLVGGSAVPAVEGQSACTSAALVAEVPVGRTAADGLLVRPGVPAARAPGALAAEGRSARMPAADARRSGVPAVDAPSARASDTFAAEGQSVQASSADGRPVRTSAALVGEVPVAGTAADGVLVRSDGPDVDGPSAAESQSVQVPAASGAEGQPGPGAAPVGPVPALAADRLWALGRDTAVIEGTGRVVQLSPRHSEIVMALVLIGRGVTGDRLAVELSEREVHASTLRAEMTRLRAILGHELLGSRPYALLRPVRTDYDDVTALLAEGRVADALARYPGPLLPRSDAPTVVEHRRALEQQLRGAVLGSGDPRLLRRWVDTSWGTDDFAAWAALARTLPGGSPQRAAAAARARALDRGAAVVPQARRHAAVLQRSRP